MPLRDEALLVALYALDLGLVPQERRDEFEAFLRNCPSDETAPQVLVERQWLTLRQLDEVLAHIEERRRRQEDGESPPDDPPEPRVEELTNDAPVPDGQAEALPRPFGDDYELRELAGEGAMAWVYKAWQHRLRRHVAIKIMKPEYAARRDFMRRFQTEAGAGRLRHPNIVSVHEADTHDGQYFLVMDFIDGASLAALMKQELVSRKECVALLEKVARAVDYAHRHGVIHRDLKPANILVDETGEPFVTDFGLAKDLTAEFSISMTGDIIGSLHYMSPEQAEARPRYVDRRTDVYSLGAILYHVYAGRPPFTGTASEVLAGILRDRPFAPSEWNPRTPEAIDRICLACLRKDPKWRYQTAEELADELRRFLNEEPIDTPHPSPRPTRRPSPRGRVSRSGAMAFALGALIWAVWLLVWGLYDPPRFEWGLFLGPICCIALSVLLWLWSALLASGGLCRCPNCGEPAPLFGPCPTCDEMPARACCLVPIVVLLAALVVPILSLLLHNLGPVLKTLIRWLVGKP